MAEQTAALTVGQRDAPEPRPLHAGNAVMTRQPLVEERVVRGQQLRQRPILAELAVDEELGLALEGLAQVLVEIGEEIGIGRRVADVPEQRATGRRSCRRAPSARGSAIMRRTCASSTFGVLQSSARRGVEQLVVRDAAPEEERQPRGELEIGQPVRGTSGDARGIALGAEEEVGIDQNPLERELDAGIEALPSLRPLR